jgi:hypothetical protein
MFYFSLIRSLIVRSAVLPVLSVMRHVNVYSRLFTPLPRLIVATVDVFDSETF